LPTASPTADSAQEQGIGGSILEVTSPPVDIPTISTQVAQADVQQQPEDPLNITATAIIQRATQTQAANLTATAFSVFGTPTPTVGPTITPIPGVFPTATPGQIVPGANCVHEVRAGENLFRISLQYGVTINDIAQASGVVNPSLILVGQRLTIPGCGTTGSRPPATSTPQITAVPGTTPIVNPPAGGTTYTVQQGETLYQISLRFGVPVNSIAAANGISNINLIFINQQLVIPPS
jgi:LysM repeat protein